MNVAVGLLAGLAIAIAVKFGLALVAEAAVGSGEGSVLDRTLMGGTLTDGGEWFLGIVGGVLGGKAVAKTIGEEL